jgi:hypothetical protein
LTAEQIRTTLRLAKFWRLESSIHELIKFFGPEATLGNVAAQIQEARAAFAQDPFRSQGGFDDDVG